MRFLLLLLVMPLAGCCDPNDDACAAASAAIASGLFGGAAYQAAQPQIAPGPVYVPRPASPLETPVQTVQPVGISPLITGLPNPSSNLSPLVYAR